MARHPKRASAKSGRSPGELIYIGEASEAKPRILVSVHSPGQFDTYSMDRIENAFAHLESGKIVWIDIEGLHDVSIVAAIGQRFDIHPLVLEDILNTHQRPKFDEYPDHLFVVLKAVEFDPSQLRLHYEQISLLLFDGLVVSFSEKVNDLHRPIRKRLENPSGRLRTQGADYLAYALIDNIVDRYFGVEDGIDHALESVEDDLLRNPGVQTLMRIQLLKRELSILRRVVSPLRDLFSAMLRSDTPLIQKKTHLYLRDVYDHTIRMIEIIETHRDLIGGMLEIYLSSISNRMNEVMKVLAIFASVFIPLTFLAGVYGMNFEYMPELAWKWSYPAIWGLFIAMVLGILYYFKRRNWL